MSGEKILVGGDSIQGPTGFANNLAGVAWSLADEYEVHTLGLQSQVASKIDVTFEGETRTIVEHPNLPRSNDKWDFGRKSLGPLVENLKPDVLLTVNDIQMIQHIPSILYPNNVKITLMDMPSKKMVSGDAAVMELEGEMQRFKEKYPLDMKWILLGPQDGDPPMRQWGDIYGVADQVVAMSKYGQGIYKEFFGIDCPYIYHGVDSNIFKPADKSKELQDKFVIGNFNRNQPRKQPIRCIEAFAKFAKDKPDVLLHMQMDWNDIFGWPIEYFSHMYGCINKMIRPKPIGMPREEVVNTYNMWDLNLNATGGEGFGLTTIEGAACGVPNIITDYTTSKELVIDGQPGPRGTLVPPIELYWEKMDVAAVQRAAMNVDKCVDIFNKYYYNRDLIKQHGEAARKWTLKYCSYTNLQNDWKKLVKETLNKS